MRIREFAWPQDRIDHIDRHGVTPEEVEEACFGQALVQRAKSEGENPVFYVLGQTDAGRYLFCVIIRSANDGRGKAAIPPMEKSMNSQRLPQTDSIQELAKFWDTHDVTEFEDELEEVGERVFERDTEITVQLDTGDANAVRAMAKSRGVGDSELIRQWILEKIHAT
jgi:uncharacterized DUF497 family protein